MKSKEELIEVMAEAISDNPRFRDVVLADAEAALTALCKALPSVNHKDPARGDTSYVFYNQLKGYG